MGFLGIIEQLWNWATHSASFFGKFVACTAEPEAAGTVRVDKY